MQPGVVSCLESDAAWPGLSTTPENNCWASTALPCLMNAPAIAGTCLLSLAPVALKAHLQSWGTGRPRLPHSPISMRASKPPLCATIRGGGCSVGGLLMLLLLLLRLAPLPPLQLGAALLPPPPVPAVMNACSSGATWPNVGRWGSCSAWLVVPHTCRGREVGQSVAGHTSARETHFWLLTQRLHSGISTALAATPVGTPLPPWPRRPPQPPQPLVPPPHRCLPAALGAQRCVGRCVAAWSTAGRSAG